MHSEDFNHFKSHIKRLAKYIIENEVDLSTPYAFEKLSMEIKKNQINFNQTQEENHPQEVNININKRFVYSIRQTPVIDPKMKVDDLDSKFRALQRCGKGFS